MSGEWGLGRAVKDRPGRCGDIRGLKYHTLWYEILDWLDQYFPLLVQQGEQGDMAVIEEVVRGL